MFLILAPEGHRGRCRPAGPFRVYRGVRRHPGGSLDQEQRPDRRERPAVLSGVPERGVPSVAARGVRR